MMTSENYSAPRRYQIEKSEGRKYHKESDRKETGSYYEEHGTAAGDSTDLCTPDSSESGRLRRGRRSKDHITDNPPATTTEDGEIEGATATEKPKSLKKEKSTGKKRKDRKNLREKRRSTGVVIMPGANNNDEQVDEARQTMENTKQNESIGTEEVSPSSNDASGTPVRSSRTTRDDVDRSNKQELLDRLEQLERNLEQKTKEVETLKTENKRLRDDNNALLRVVNQVSSLKAK